MGVMDLASAAPGPQPLSGTVGDPDSLFHDFMSGSTFPISDVEQFLAGARVDAAAVESVGYGYFRKIVARVRLADGTARFAKIALHPCSVRLLEREAGAIRAARAAPLWGVAVPDVDLRVLARDRAVALLTPLPGSPLSAVSALRAVTGPFPYSGATERLDVHLDRLSRDMPDCDESRRARRALDRLAGKAGLETIPVAPAHGDFVYWNVLRREDGLVSILDFEDYNPAAVAGYDRFYWHTLPLTRFAIRHGLCAAQAATVKPYARRIWNAFARRSRVPVAQADHGKPHFACLALGLTLAGHMGQMLKKHELADIGALIGNEAMALRGAVIAQYLRLMEQLAR